MEEKTPNLQLQEPVLPESLVPAMDLKWLWIAIAAFVLITAIVVLLAMRKKRVAGVDPIARRRAAYQAAKQAFENLQSANARDAAVQTSLILRRFPGRHSECAVVQDPTASPVLRP